MHSTSPSAKPCACLHGRARRKHPTKSGLSSIRPSILPAAMPCSVAAASATYLWYRSSAEATSPFTLPDKWWFIRCLIYGADICSSRPTSRFCSKHSSTRSRLSASNRSATRALRASTSRCRGAWVSSAESLKSLPSAFMSAEALRFTASLSTCTRIWPVSDASRHAATRDCASPI